MFRDNNNCKIEGGGKLYGQGKQYMNLQREKFCQNLFKGMTGAEAYKDAYNKPDANERYAAFYASKLKSQEIIQKRLMDLRDELAKKNLVTVEKVLEEYSHIAFDDIKNYLSFSTEMVDVVDDDTGEVTQYPRHSVIIKDSKDIDTRNVSEIFLDAKGQLKFKLYPKDSALDKLGQYLGMWVNRSEITGKDGGPVELKDAREMFINRLVKRVNEGTDK